MLPPDLPHMVLRYLEISSDMLFLVIGFNITPFIPTRRQLAKSLFWALAVHAIMGTVVLNDLSFDVVSKPFRRGISMSTSLLLA